MKIKTLAFLVACTAAAAVVRAEYTLEGIGVVSPGFTMTKRALGMAERGESGRGVFPEGFEINSIDDAERNIERGLVVYDTNVLGGPVNKQVIAGYNGDVHGNFDYESDGSTDGGYPAGRWEHGSGPYYTAEGTVSVPSAGTWTLCLGARDGSYLGFTLVTNGVSNVWTKACHAMDEHLILVVDFAEAGDYPVYVRQYSQGGDTWMELSAAKGVYDACSTDAFTLIGDALTTYQVVFNTDGGTAVDSVYRKAGRKVPKPADPQKAGLMFDGWLLDGVPFDFENTTVSSDLELVAKWIDNQTPVIVSATCSVARPTFNGSPVELPLAVVATDGDEEPLSYQWSLVGTAPSAYRFDEVTSATPTVTVSGPGEYTFQVEVTDGHETVSETVTVTVAAGAQATSYSYAGTEYAGSPIGTQGTTQDPVLEDYPWGRANNDGYKAAWRSTAAGDTTDGGNGRKNLLLDEKRENAYGLDGYHFGGACANADGKTTTTNVSSGTVYADGLVVSNVTDYISEITFSNVEVGNEPCLYWIDDPRLPISEDVKDFRPGVLTVKGPEETFVTFAKIKFNIHVAAHPRIRLAVLSGYGDGYKPKSFSVGTTSHEWEGCDEGYGHLTWAFYDIVNACPGGEVELAVEGWNQYHWQSYRIEGLAFDSEEHPIGLKIVIR